MTDFIPSAPIDSSLDGKIQWQKGPGKIDINSPTIAIRPTNQGGGPNDIQKAIDALAQNGGTVVLKNGTYLLENDLIIPTNITLEGESGAAVIDFQGSAFQIKASGTLVYNTGTVSATNGSNTVTGSGTSWDAGMEGSYIILSGIWYLITDVASATSLTIQGPFEVITFTGQTYTIADVAGNITVANLTVQNSTDTEGAISYKYLLGARIRDVNVYDSTIGIRYEACNGIRSAGFEVIGCGTGLYVLHGGAWTFYDFFVYASSGDGIKCDKLISASIANYSISTCGGNGITLDSSCSAMGIYDGTLTTNTGRGIEISNSTDIELSALTIQSNGSDGIKLTTNADRCAMGNGINFQNNGGYGLNIANANCDKNTVIGSNFNGNTSGTINDAGTNTINSLNQT